MSTTDPWAGNPEDDRTWRAEAQAQANRRGDLPPIPSWSYPPGAAPLQPVTVNVTQARPQQQPNHLLHAVLSLLTGGLWLPVWAVISHRAKKANRRG